MSAPRLRSSRTLARPPSWNAPLAREGPTASSTTPPIVRPTVAWGSAAAVGAQSIPTTTAPHAAAPGRRVIAERSAAAARVHDGDDAGERTLAKGVRLACRASDGEVLTGKAGHRGRGAARHRRPGIRAVGLRQVHIVAGAEVDEAPGADVDGEPELVRFDRF